MARKTRRRQPPPRARRPAGPTQGTTAAAPTAGAAPRAGQAGRIGGDQSLVRSVEMSLAPGAPARRSGRGSSRIVLDNVDPAIPLDRVPYFVSDLVRLGLVVAAMIVLLVIGAEFVIPLAVR